MPVIRRLTALTAAFAAALLLQACVEDLSTPAGESPPAPKLSAAEQAALVEDGRAVAEANCAACHAVTPDGQSPNAAAPHFRTLLARYNPETLETELVEGMSVAHAPMPQFQFNPKAAEALIAYLRSIQSSEPGAALVDMRCAKCHAVGVSGTSPYPGAQPFRNLGRRWNEQQLRDALKAGIIAEHDKAEARVPPMRLSDDEIASLLSYLRSIATKENPAPKRF